MNMMRLGCICVCVWCVGRGEWAGIDDGKTTKRTIEAKKCARFDSKKKVINDDVAGW